MRLTWWPYALVAFCYLATSPYHAGLNNPNEGVRVYMTRALVDAGTFAIDGPVREWGNVDDKAIREGRLYSSKAPLQSLIGVPVYALQKHVAAWMGVRPTKQAVTTVLRIFASSVFGILFSWFLLHYARRRTAELQISTSFGTAIGLAGALGTMIYPYSLLFAGHLLAAITAGGTYFAAIALARCDHHSTRRCQALLLGFLGACAPFAEYPAALLAVPAALGALFATPTWKRRLEVSIFALLGGLAPFSLGLWAHDRAWGSPFRTGYGFLENRDYVAVHSTGFFGVSLPKAEAFAGALFSPGTGLFFFSPILLAGLFVLVKATVVRKQPPEQEGLPRAIAIAGLVGLVLELLFISGHAGWRGGWTLGPRYIIPVVPLLFVWVVEALAAPRMRAWIMGLALVSILGTGFAAALYPHLSDVYTNPLLTFVLPSYLRGESTYGLASLVGFTGTMANAVHVLPLSIAILFIAWRGFQVHGSDRDDGGANRDDPRTSRTWRIARVTTVPLIFACIVALIPERNPEAAARENERLWGFWEPPRRLGPTPLYTARDAFRTVRVESIAPDGSVRPCVAEGSGCRYGDEAWQHFGPEFLDMKGRREAVLFMHPIADRAVRAVFPVIPRGNRAVLRYGLSDASVASGNPSPVVLRVEGGGRGLAEINVSNSPGLHELEIPLSESDQPVAIELRTERDGARVFGFDLDLR